MHRHTITARQLLQAKRADVTGVISVASGDTVLHALKVMREKNIGAVVVLDGAELRGIVTERDYARKVEIEGRTAQGTLVHEIMTKGPMFYARPSDEIEKCQALMAQNSVRHLPVVEDGRVIGVLSIRDVLEQIIAEEKHVIRDLEAERLEMTTDTGAY